ncbi:hypothetical protein FZC84_02260 [Rossellomorea vietnamensis]|uniref:Uncharacterized protein n=1 Tax=Rossellomorea vietnamensis TaxID=218284 RepID=A0A5D4MKH8_9BACI|nr:hypothetical protein FZC84_02260 [Rossellomorea vietnamensis]
MFFECYFTLYPITKADWSGSRATSCGTSGTGETPQAKPRRLTARPAESYGWSGNPLLLNSQTHCEKPLLLRFCPSLSLKPAFELP